MDIESRFLLSYQKIEYILYFVIFSAMLLYEKQSSMVRLANLEFEQDPTCPQDLLKVLIQGMSLLQESKTSLDLGSNQLQISLNRFFSSNCRVQFRIQPFDNFSFIF